MSLLKSTTSDSRVYVGNLPQFVRQRDLEDHFDKYGKVRGIDIHNKFDPAFAFIEFDDPRDAEDAVHAEDGKKFDGNRIKVQFPRGHAKDRGDGGGGGGGYSGGRGGNRGGGGYTRGRGRGLPIRRSENRVLVSGLPTSGSWQDLKDHMREAGEVVYADVYKDGTAVCEFKNHEHMKWALKYLDDSKFKSHENETTYIRIKRDVQSRSRSRSRSRSPRRSRSRSRSRSPVRRRDSRSSRSPKRRSRSRSRSRSKSRSISRSRSRSRSR